MQELVASEVVLFVSVEWTILATKYDLADVLESVTSIPQGVLRMEVELRSTSIAARMSWAAERDTTRPEDQAYCLLGIFNIHMPLLYGEGRQAFRRLQEEIMKQSIDPSLFAWGIVGYWFPNEEPSETAHGHDDYTSYLLARSPDDFDGDSSGRITFMHNTSQESSP